MVRQDARQTTTSAAVMPLCICSSKSSLSWACAFHDTAQTLLPICAAAHAMSSDATVWPLGVMADGVQAMTPIIEEFAKKVRFADYLFLLTGFISC